MARRKGKHTALLLLFLVIVAYVAAGAKTSPAGKSGSAKRNTAGPTVKGSQSPRVTTATVGTRRQSAPKQTGVGKESQGTRAKPLPSGSRGKDARQASTAGASASTSRDRAFFLRLADPYELTRFFRVWLSLTDVAIDPQAGQMWLRFARDRSLRQLGEILGEAGRAYERRRTNARRASVALYLAGRLRQQSVAIPPAPVLYHTVALRRAMVNDALALEGYAELEELVRRAEVQMLEAVTKIVDEGISPQGRSLTVATLDAVAAWNTHLLARSYPENMQEILHLAGKLGATEKALVSLRELGPPAPETSPAYWPLVGEDLPLPLEQLPPPRRSMTHEKMATPAQQAITLRVKAGQQIRCAADGSVRFAGEMRGLGHVVIVEHAQERLSVYGLLGGTTVKVGDTVRAGDVLGFAERAADNSSVDVIFEVREGTTPVTPRLLLGDRDPYSVIVRGR